MAFHEVQFPNDIAYGATGGPEFATSVVATASGYEQRNINWSSARGRWDVASGLKKQTQLDTLSYANYSMMPDSRRMREALSRWFVSIPVTEAQMADFYFMAWGREPQHVALITDHGIIHSYSGVGKVVEHSLDDRWQQRIAAAYRFPYFVEGA